jgi:hypothetical protein
MVMVLVTALDGLDSGSMGSGVAGARFYKNWRCAPRGADSGADVHGRELCPSKPNGLNAAELPTLLLRLLLALQPCADVGPICVFPRSTGEVPLVGMMVLLVCAAMVVGRGAACPGSKR